tara:strand:+ start:43 stop:510 length:468 start_codon:yes stop_codon:yes gene_type:complete
MENKFYKSTDKLVYARHENYKTYLTEKRKEARRQIVASSNNIKHKRDRIKKLEAELSERLEARKLYKKDEQSVDTEYSYRKKIVALQKKHDFLDVLWDGDEDVYTTWVYSNDFDGGDDWEGDPFQDSHFHDSYKEAYDACLKYVKYHELSNKEQD